jgi:hypothetical protein
MEMAKIPCGFYLEEKEGTVFYIMPRTNEVYRDLCVDCIAKL